MATEVRDTKAGKSISAWVVLNKKGEHVATVNAHFANSGRVTVDVWNHGDAVERCLDAAIRADIVTEKTLEKAIEASEAKRDWCPKGSDQHTGFAARDLFGLQQGGAGGYGYDKFAAALSGLWIDGQQLANHCGTVANAQKAKERLLKKYAENADAAAANPALVKNKDWFKQIDASAKKIGARFANYSIDKNRYTSLHFEPGLQRLETLGYRVIQAI